nr:MAG TPA: hypothetical protein [Caudoviricetes sp.]
MLWCWQYSLNSSIAKVAEHTSVPYIEDGVNVALFCFIFY